MGNEIALHPNAEIVEASGVMSILENVRPYWKDRRLIERVLNLLKSDPSSACQRILNAAIQDLREKIIIAGIDIAREAASANRMSPLAKPEDVEAYSTKDIIDISHFIGFLSRAEWRRLARCYEIRRDLEHEDDEYEAGVEDCVYIFKTAVDVVLSRDPIKVISVSDIVAQIELPNPIVLSQEYLTDYEHAPKQRQMEILKMLIGKYLDPRAPEILKTNAINCLKSLQGITQNQAKVELGSAYQAKLGRDGVTQDHFFVMNAAGLLGYFTTAARDSYFADLLRTFDTHGYHWKKWKVHTELLQLFIASGEFEHIPAERADGFIIWMFKCFIGEPGGYGAGYARRVFFSDTGAPICKLIIKRNGPLILNRIQKNAEIGREIERVIDNSDLRRRFDDLLDLIGYSEQPKE